MTRSVPHLIHQLEELIRSLATVSEAEGVERGKLLNSGNGVRDEGSERTGGVHDVLLRGPRESGVDGSGQTSGSQLLP